MRYSTNLTMCLCLTLITGCSGTGLIGPTDSAICGDGIKDSTEVCDGTDLDGQSCEGLGFDRGQLRCESDCSAFEQSLCANNFCGDQYITDDEECDSDNFDDATCIGLGFGAGTLHCTDQCKIDPRDCGAPATCGNDTIQNPEICDGADLGGENCESLGWDDGTLSCLPNCTGFDTLGCGILVKPIPISPDTVLYNPGMGFTSFHDNGWGGRIKNTYDYQGKYYFGQAIDYSLIDEDGNRISSTADLNQVNLVAERSAYGWGADVIFYGSEIHPRATTAYWRWCWSTVQPNAPANPDNVQPSDFDFSEVEAAVEQARSRGQVIALRIFPTQGDGCFPSWLIDKIGNDGVRYDEGSDFFPNHNNQAFKDWTKILVDEFGRRYNYHPVVDHVDMGAVGCWGEWNTACLPEGVGAEHMPTRESQRDYIQMYLDAFPDTPLVALGSDDSSPPDDPDGMMFALANGAGWRVDCWGDFGFFGNGSWYHHLDTYPMLVENAGTSWHKGGVQLESCGILNQWPDENIHPAGHSWSRDNPNGAMPALDWAIESHASVINAKSAVIPPNWMPAIYEFMTKIGYRFEMRSIQHRRRASPGDKIVLVSTWANLGIAPHYHRRPLAFRLRDAAGNIAVMEKNSVDIRTWLPIDDGGSEYTVTQNITLPAGMATGEYRIDVAILAHPNRATPDVPEITLAIEGLREDGWHDVSAMEVD